MGRRGLTQARWRGRRRWPLWGRLASRRIRYSRRRDGRRVHYTRGGDRAQRLQRQAVCATYFPLLYAVKTATGMYKPTTTDHDSSRWPSSSSFREVTTHVNSNHYQLTEGTGHDTSHGKAVRTNPAAAVPPQTSEHQQQRQQLSASQCHRPGGGVGRHHENANQGRRWPLAAYSRIQAVQL